MNKISQFSDAVGAWSATSGNSGGHASQPGRCQSRNGNEGGNVRWLFRLPAQFLGIWLFLVVGASDVAAGVLKPVPGTKITTSSITVSWQSEPGATAYMLGVGTSQQALASAARGDISFQMAGLKTSLNVFGVPLNGKTVYMRLWTQTASRWKYKDYSYSTAVGEQDRPASITSPVMPGPLATGSVLQWSGRGVSEYVLSVGPSLDSVTTKPLERFDYYRGQATSIMLNHIPEDGSPLYVRLWSRILSKWFFTDYLYESGLVGPAMVTLNSPSPEVPLDQHAKRFSWAPVAGATQYVLTLASSRDRLTTPLTTDLFGLSTVETEAVATGIPLDGNDVYVRLWALVDNEWFYSDTTYGSIYSPEPPDYEAECLERRWQKVSVDVNGESRDLLWKGPDNGRWEKGAIIILHGGAGASSNWCSDTLVTHEPYEFARAALAAGFAVFALNSQSFSDAWGQNCGKRFDALGAADSNRDLRYIEKVLSSTIASLRPSGSSNSQFLTGISSGSLMTLRAATRFNSRITAFAAAAAADPYGTYLYCAATPGQEQRPGFYGDVETYSPIGSPGACVKDSYPNERVWETEGPANLPPFKLLHHRNDPAVDLSCMAKARQQLVSHGYEDRGTFLMGDGTTRDVDAHFWQSEYNTEIIEFFKSVSEE